MGKTKYVIYLSEEDKEFLNKVIQNEPEATAMRARILLASDFNNPCYLPVSKMAKELGTSKTTIQNIRARYAEFGLKDSVIPKGIHSPERSPNLTDEKRKAIIDMIYSAPPKGYRRWTVLLLCDECVNRGIFDYVPNSVIMKILREEKIDLKNLRR